MRNKKIVNKEIVDREVQKLVNMSRLLTEDKIRERITNIIKNYMSEESGILFFIEDGLLNVVSIDY